MVDTAVIPAAGYGSRMRPLTIVIPKEMFPLGHYPIIEHTVIELVSSGIRRICIVIRKGKEVIKEYFDGRRKLYKGIEIRFTYQEAHLGLGDAVRMAKDFIKGRPFIMAIPDQILISNQPATKQLLEASKNDEGIWNSMVRIPKNDVRFFKGSRPFKCRKRKKGFYHIENISADETSLIRGFGRTVFLAGALEYMTENYRNDETGEVDLFKTFQALTHQFPIYGMILKGQPCDVGTWEGYYFYQSAIFEHLKAKGEPL